MVIYGVALLAGCLLVGSYVGELLGIIVGVDANVGGVGFAMILLILVSDKLRDNGKFPAASADGVLFWSAMYIPIVVAMASIQNVVDAVGAGPVAFVAGLGATLLSWAVVPAIARIGGADEPLGPLQEEDA